MTAYQRPLDADAVANNFRVFGAADCGSEPLYAALCPAIADDASAIALVLEAPYRQRRPVLFFAAVHDLLLAGVDHPLAAFYRTVARPDAFRDDVEHAWPVLADFCRVHREALVDAFRTRSTQTNEVGRSAVLRLALATLDAGRPIALIDVGCSAGLNLFVDRFRVTYRSETDAIATGPASNVDVKAAVSGLDATTLPTALPAIVERVGIDVAPLDMRDPLDARWLRACVWPSESDRHARLDAAIAITTREAFTLVKADALDGLDDALARVDPGTRPVVFHSWVASYFDGASRARFAHRMMTMVEDQDGAWVSGEAAGAFAALPAPSLPDDAPPETREATSWHRTIRGADGRPASTLLARSHPHGRWIDWLV